MLKHNLDKTSWEMIEFLKETTKKNLVFKINNKEVKVTPQGRTI